MTYYVNPTSTTSATISVAGTGSILTTAGTNGVSWNSGASITAADTVPNSIQVKGQARFYNDVIIDGDVEIKGHSIAESLKKIEERLSISTVQLNPELEQRWVKLKELGDQYRELEKEIKEKEEIIRILKS